MFSARIMEYVSGIMIVRAVADLSGKSAQSAQNHYHFLEKSLYATRPGLTRPMIVVSVLFSVLGVHRGFATKKKKRTSHVGPLGPMLAGTDRPSFPV